MRILRRILSCRQEKEFENMKADIEQQKQDMEEQKLLTQYVAEMSDIYIPEEEVEDNVSDPKKNEETV